MMVALWWGTGQAAQAVFVDLSQLEDKEDSLRLICRAPDRSAEPSVFIRDQSEFSALRFLRSIINALPQFRNFLLSPQTLKSIADVEPKGGNDRQSKISSIHVGGGCEGHWHHVVSVR